MSNSSMQKIKNETISQDVKWERFGRQKHFITVQFVVLGIEFHFTFLQSQVFEALSLELRDLLSTIKTENLTKS